MLHAFLWNGRYILSYRWTLIALHSVMKICLIMSSVIIKNIKVSWLRLFLIKVVVIISRLFLNLLRSSEMKTKYENYISINMTLKYSVKFILLFCY